MKTALIQFNPWDKAYNFSCEGMDLLEGAYVIVETKIGVEMGKVIAPAELSDNEISALKEPLKPVTRKANQEDIEIVLNNNKNRSKYFSECKALIKKHDLPLKLVDVYISFDGERITFAFISDGRVDFRDLLKDLNKKFQCNIRLQQIGIRDEIKLSGDVGCCGRSLCCRSFYKDLGNVTSDLADLQQVAHRGSERLSGVCGRLKCCLNYEKEHYCELAGKLPLIGEKIKTEHGMGEVIAWHVLKQTVDVLLDNQSIIVEVPIAK